MVEPYLCLFFRILRFLGLPSDPSTGEKIRLLRKKDCKDRKRSLDNKCGFRIFLKTFTLSGPQASGIGL
jgi:hypothetical protein